MTSVEQQDITFPTAVQKASTVPKAPTFPFLATWEATVREQKMNNPQLLVLQAMSASYSGGITTYMAKSSARIKL